MRLKTIFYIEMNPFYTFSMLMNDGIILKSKDSNCKNEITHKMYEDCMTIMGLKYDREWEPVYQAFLLHPLAQEVLASPERNNT